MLQAFNKKEVGRQYSEDYCQLDYNAHSPPIGLEWDFMDMFKVLDTLDEVGYDGAVYPDHVPSLVGDESRRTALAFAVGYTKALMSVLGRG